LYKGKSDAGLVAFGVLKPGKRAYNDPSDPYLFKIEIPGMLSLLGNREMGSFVPGIQDVIDGGYQTKNGVALSFAEKQAKGKLAIQSLGDYQKAMAAKDTVKAAGYKAKLKANYAQFGYGYIEKAETLIPHVPTVFYSFHLMVILGMYFIVFFIVVLIFQNNGKLEKTKWLLWVAVLSIPLGYLASQLGWVVAEVGRQPWAIQDVLPVNAAISNLSASSVIITFFLFLILFSALLVAEIRIMLNQIKKGPSAH
jgi:cytochrome d ubiquinol oxidase subunit I